MSVCELIIPFIMYWVMVSVLASSTDRVKPKATKLVCVASPHSALRRKSKDWLARKQDVSEWGDTSIHGMLFQ